MKIAIVKSSELVGTSGFSCWSPARFVGECHNCSSVNSCKEPQAHTGRIKLQEERVNKLKEKLSSAEDKLNNMKRG